MSEQGRGAMGWQRFNYFVSGGCLLSLSLCKRGCKICLRSGNSFWTGLKKGDNLLKQKRHITAIPWLLFFAPKQGCFSLTSLSYCRPPLRVVALQSLFFYLDMPPPPSDWFRLPLSQTCTCINTLALSSQLFFWFTQSMKTEQAECSEMLAHKIRMLGNHPQERIQYGNETVFQNSERDH